MHFMTCVGLQRRDRRSPADAGHPRVSPHAKSAGELSRTMEPPVIGSGRGLLPGVRRPRVTMGPVRRPPPSPIRQTDGDDTW
jgi:hypothetical protein